jgi:hypothetical protein
MHEKRFVPASRTGSWIEGMRYMLADYSTAGRPWPTYRDEDHVWM